MNDKCKRYGRILCALLIIIWFLINHIYRVTSIPYGINVDEMGMGYDAWSLSHYGVDRYVKSFPVYLMNYGDGQSILYAYITMVLFKITGFDPTNILILRLPSIIMSVVSAVSMAIFYLVVSHTKSEGINKAFLSTFFMGVLPVFVMSSRFGLDCNLLLPMSGLVLPLACYAAMYKKPVLFLILGVMQGILLYSYALSHPVSLIFTVLYFFYLLKGGIINLKSILCWFIPLGIMALPLLLMHIVNIMHLPEPTIGFFTITKLLSYRSNQFRFFEFGLEGVVNCAKTVFGYDNYTFNSIPMFGTITYFAIPLFCIGIFKTGIDILKGFVNNKPADSKSISSSNYQEMSHNNKIEKSIEKYFDHRIPFLLWFILYFIMGSMIQSVNVSRMNGIYISILFFIVEGICILKNGGGGYRRFCSVILMVLIAIMSIKFSVFYFTEGYGDFFNNEHLFHPDLRKEVKLLNEIDKSDKKVIYVIGSKYTHYLASAMISPYDYEMSDTNYPIIRSKGNVIQFYESVESFLEQENLRDEDNEPLAVTNAIYIIEKVLDHDYSYTLLEADMNKIDSSEAEYYVLY